jgi:glyoxylase-like metal-dependent hydrolase (beta-lactamase superfamily II)
MIALASGISYIDLQFQGIPRVIATAVLSGPGGVALVDPGPSSTLETLEAGLGRAGISMPDVTALLLTHIHLDHAGAAGTLLHDHPKLKVFVHAKGAPHMIDPAKLVASATRLYGDAMDRLWGEVRPVPEHALVVLHGGERLEAGGHALDVAYTPGHAAHHVSFLARDARIAFVGDTAGVKVVPDGEILPPTPPPDIDLEAWHDGLVRIEQWSPDTLFLTHFGPSAPAGAHLIQLRDRLQMVSRLVRASLAREATDEEREAWFVDECRRELRQRVSDEEARVYEVAGRFDLNWRGLARYWRKKSGPPHVRAGQP